MRRFHFMRIGLPVFLAVIPLLLDISPASAQNYGTHPSPPIVAGPIHECAKSVHVTGFAPHNVVMVYSDKSDPNKPDQPRLVGQDTPHFSFADILLTRALTLGEKITAVQIQKVEGIDYTSGESLLPITVTAFTGTPEKPKVDSHLYDCGHVVPVGNLVESTTVNVFAEGSDIPIGVAEAPGTWQAVVTSALEAGKNVTAKQLACGTPSPASDNVLVSAAPNSIPTPKIVSAVLGADTITVTNLLIGALLQVKDAGTEIGAGYATSSTNFQALSSPIAQTSSIQVTQTLCTGQQATSPIATITTVLPPPVLVAPIYAGQQFVFLRNVLPTATIQILSGLDEIGFGGGSAGPDGLLALALARPAIETEYIYAVERIANLSTSSNTVQVSSAAAPPTVSVLGGETYFNPEGGETPIPAPVLLRGNAGAQVRVTTGACILGVDAVVTGPTGISATLDTPQQNFPGQFTWQVPWASLGNGNVPGGIPVGTYTAKATNKCNTAIAQTSFYVIFDPKEVAGPDRLSFNETGIFIAPSSRDPSIDVAFGYDLHIDDNRVFSKALAHVEGKTSQYDAMTALLNYEAGLFGYPGFSGLQSKNVLDLLALTSDKSVACYEDALVLVAFLRSVGIPSRPVSGDTASEYFANHLQPMFPSWTFDVWVEARAVGRSETAPRWWAMHSHQDSPGTPLGPNTRAEAGTPGTNGVTKWNVYSQKEGHYIDVATKEYNDYILTANENWNGNDLNYGAVVLTPTYQACEEPTEAMKDKKTWVDHLCLPPDGDGYWGEGHWVCDLPPLPDEITISGLGTYQVGDLVTGEVRIDNTSSTDKQGTLDLIVAIVHPLSNFFPDAQVDLGGATVVVPAGGSQVYSFAYTLPVGASSADGYVIQAKAQYTSGQSAEGKLAPFGVQALYDATLAVPSPLQACDPSEHCYFDATLTVVSRTTASVTDLNFGVFLPSGVQTPSGDSQVTLHEDELPAGGQIVKTIPLQLVGPNDAGSFLVNVTTANGGLAQETTTVKIDPEGPTMFTGAGAAMPLPPNQPPVASCRDVMMAANASCQATVTAADVDKGSYDPDGPPPICTLSPSGPFGLGQTPVTLTCVDNRGASASCTATVTVVDDTPPTIVCPASVRVPCANAAGAKATFSVSSADNCHVQTTTCTKSSGSTFPLGAAANTCTASDGAGNVASCTFYVTVALGDDPICCPAGTHVILGDSKNNVLNGTNGSDCILGRGGQDTINGNGGNDFISGGDGDDVISGGAGNDVIFGGAGQDILKGDSGNDVIIGGDGDDTMYGGDQDDILVGGQGQDKLYGENGNDTLVGEEGDDRLEGGAGDDKLIGGGLHDVCIGGPGNDTFLTCESQTQ